MFVLIAIFVGVGVASASFFVIRVVAKRPANGEVKHLIELDRQILANIRSLNTCRYQQDARHLRVAVLK